MKLTNRLLTSTYTLVALVAAHAAFCQTGFAQVHPEATGAIQGKLWVVSVAEASSVGFPAPSATPDATFTTNGIAYIGQERSSTASYPYGCYTISTWLSGCETPAYGLKFSGLSNPNLPNGEAASASTLMSGPSWGIMVQFEFSEDLFTGENIVVIHDDGIALEIDGTLVGGFTSTEGLSTNTVVWTGGGGSHSINLLYANATGNGAWLLFGPALCCQ
jgi:hypothetical protein